MSTETEAKNIIKVFMEIKKANNELSGLISDMEKYNTADGPNMNPNEMNKFRHTAASAYYVSKGIQKLPLFLWEN